MVAGLSPRLRGNHDQGLSRDCGGTMTRVYRRACWGTMTRVYPRACGGTVTLHADVSQGDGLSPRLLGNHDQGLSPRLRGNPHTPCRCKPRSRSIPAPAGEPSRMVANTWSVRVYPRACGGTENARQVELIGNGLSPRLRGNPSGYPPAVAGTRSIPAPAGEPRPRTR